MAKDNDPRAPYKVYEGDELKGIVFLAFYFLFLWVAWLLAVWVTKPKTVERGTT
jgi:hypothetical protein